MSRLEIEDFSELTAEDSVLLVEMARDLALQDNASTQHPAFVVQSQVRTYGISADYTDQFVFVDEEGAEIDVTNMSEVDIELAALNRVGVRDGWETVQWFLTRDGAQRYIEDNAHNLKRPRIYVESGYRNPEWQVMRALCASVLEVVVSLTVKPPAPPISLSFSCMEVDRG